MLVSSSRKASFSCCRPCLVEHRSREVIERRTEPKWAKNKQPAGREAVFGGPKRN